MNNFQIYLLLTDTGTLLTRIIKLFTKKPYNHASIAFDSELQEVYSFGRKQPRNPFIGGFVKENIREAHFKNASCAIYKANITKEQYLEMKHFIEDIEKRKGFYRYNFIGLFSFIINKQIKRKNAYFCSEFVATLLQNSNIVNFQKPVSLITPYEISEEDIFSLVYQGKLANYHRESTVNRLSSNLNLEDGYQKVFMNRTYSFFN